MGWSAPRRQPCRTGSTALWRLQRRQQARTSTSGHGRTWPCAVRCQGDHRGLRRTTRRRHVLCRPALAGTSPAGKEGTTGLCLGRRTPRIEMAKGAQAWAVLAPRCAWGKEIRDAWSVAFAPGEKCRLRPPRFPRSQLSPCVPGMPGGRADAFLSMKRASPLFLTRHVELFWRRAKTAPTKGLFTDEEFERRWLEHRLL